MNRNAEHLQYPAQATHFTGPRTHRQVPDTGHNLPQEAPRLPPRQSLTSPTPIVFGKKPIASTPVAERAVTSQPAEEPCRGDRGRASQTGRIDLA
jgi:hypothetical protein